MLWDISIRFFMTSGRVHKDQLWTVDLIGRSEELWSDLLGVVLNWLAKMEFMQRMWQPMLCVVIIWWSCLYIEHVMWFVWWSPGNWATFGHVGPLEEEEKNIPLMCRRKMVFGLLMTWRWLVRSSNRIKRGQMLPNHFAYNTQLYVNSWILQYII